MTSKSRLTISRVKEPAQSTTRRRRGPARKLSGVDAVELNPGILSSNIKRISIPKPEIAGRGDAFACVARANNLMPLRRVTHESGQTIVADPLQHRVLMINAENSDPNPSLSRVLVNLDFLPASVDPQGFIEGRNGRIRTSYSRFECFEASANARNFAFEMKVFLKAGPDFDAELRVQAPTNERSYRAAGGSLINSALNSAFSAAFPAPHGTSVDLSTPIFLGSFADAPHFPPQNTPHLTIPESARVMKNTTGLFKILRERWVAQDGNTQVFTYITRIL